MTKERILRLTNCKTCPHYSVAEINDWPHCHHPEAKGDEELPENVYRPQYDFPSHWLPEKGRIPLWCPLEPAPKHTDKDITILEKVIQELTKGIEGQQARIKELEQQLEIANRKWAGWQLIAKDNDEYKARIKELEAVFENCPWKTHWCKLKEAKQ